MTGGLAVRLLTAWADLRASYRSIAAGATERLGLGLVLLACFLFFVAGLPRTASDPLAADPEVGFAALVAGRLIGLMLMAPLIFYGLAGVSHLIARTVGGQGSYRGARLALFWALAVAAPLELLRAGAMALGLPLGLAGALVVGALFLWAWASFLAEAEGFDARGPVAAVLALPLLPVLYSSV